MQLPAFKEKITGLSRFYRYLLLFNLVLIVFISAGVAYYFYFGYHFQSISPEGVKVQKWIRGKKIDLIAGTVIQKNGNLFTIEREGEKVEIEIDCKVFYCGERGETTCSVVNGSEIQVGQFLTVQKPGPWDEDARLKLGIERDMLVKVWD